jgi:hypothetical protein
MRVCIFVLGVVLTGYAWAAEKSATTRPAAREGPVLREAAPRLTAGQRIVQARVAEPGRNEVSVAAKEYGGVVRCDRRGVEVVVAVTRGGETTMEAYRADDPAALGRARPEAYRVYDAVLSEAGGEGDAGKKFRAWFESPLAPRK